MSGPISKPFEIGQRVHVLWLESGSLFSGVIEAISESPPPTITTAEAVATAISTYDILYDESVQGKPCREKNVVRARLKSIHVGTVTCLSCLHKYELD